MDTWSQASQASWDRWNENPEWGYPQLGPYSPAYVGNHQGCVPMTTEPQIQWWVEKMDAGERSERSMGPKSRCVGSMCPTNLGKTQSLRVSERKDDGMDGGHTKAFLMFPDLCVILQKSVLAWHWSNCRQLCTASIESELFYNRVFRRHTRQ